MASVVKPSKKSSGKKNKKAAKRRKRPVLFNKKGKEIIKGTLSYLDSPTKEIDKKREALLNSLGFTGKFLDVNASYIKNLFREMAQLQMYKKAISPDTLESIHLIDHNNSSLAKFFVVNKRLCPGRNAGTIANEWKRHRLPALMIRKPMLKLRNMLDSKFSPKTILINGTAGSGKSMVLNYAVMFAIQQKWCVLWIPRPERIFSRHLQIYKATDVDNLYFQKEYSRQFFEYLLKYNESKLSKIQLKRVENYPISSSNSNADNNNTTTTTCTDDDNTKKDIEGKDNDNNNNDFIENDEGDVEYEEEFNEDKEVEMKKENIMSTTPPPVTKQKTKKNNNSPIDNNNKQKTPTDNDNNQAMSPEMYDKLMAASLKSDQSAVKNIIGAAKVEENKQETDEEFLFKFDQHYQLSSETNFTIPKTKKDQTLLHMVQHALSKNCPNPAALLYDFMEEIKLVTEFPVLLAIDNINLWHRDSAYRTAEGVPIQCSQLSFINCFLQFEQYKENSLKNGVVILSTSSKGKPLGKIDSLLQIPDQVKMPLTYSQAEYDSAIKHFQALGVLQSYLPKNLSRLEFLSGKVPKELSRFVELY